MLEDRIQCGLIMIAFKSLGFGLGGYLSRDSLSGFGRSSRLPCRFYWLKKIYAAISATASFNSMAINKSLFGCPILVVRPVLQPRQSLPQFVPS
jgi:hypothetical protein